MSIILKCIHLIKSQKFSKLLEKIWKLILRFIWKCKDPRTVETTLEKKSEVGELPVSGTHYKPIAVKTVEEDSEDKQINGETRWCRTAHVWKTDSWWSIKTIQCRKDSLLSKSCWNKCHNHSIPLWHPQSTTWECSMLDLPC